MYLSKMSQHEKIVMFGLFDRELQENMNAMKKMVEVKKSSNPAIAVKANQLKYRSQTVNTAMSDQSGRVSILPANKKAAIHVNHAVTMFTN